MKYICLICAGEMMEHLDEEDAKEHFAAYVRFADDIRRNGHYISSNRLMPPETAITVRVRNGRVTTTDGPYAETKEQLGGYFLIEATDLNEAIRIASRIPGASRGCVEVRPIAEDPPTLRITRPDPTG